MKKFEVEQNFIYLFLRKVGGWEVRACLLFFPFEIPSYMGGPESFISFF